MNVEKMVLVNFIVFNTHHNMKNFLLRIWYFMLGRCTFIFDSIPCGGKYRQSVADLSILVCDKCGCQKSIDSQA